MKNKFVLAGLASLVIAGGWAGKIQSEEAGQKKAAAAPAMEGMKHEMAHGESRKEFKVVGVEYQGTKVWIPGTLIVKKGDKVKIALINNIQSEPNTHGFAIDEFGVKSIVARGKPETVEFTADKEGLFTIYCQLHPAHIGGQLLVLSK